MEGQYLETVMAYHLRTEHAISEGAIQRLWENLAQGVEWEEFLDANHAMLHTLGQGGVARGLGRAG